MTTDVDDFLEHVGVKGMKWGQRKAEDGLSRASVAAGQAGSAVKTAAGQAGSAIGAKRQEFAAKSAVKKEQKTEIKRRIGEANEVIKTRDKERYMKTNKDGDVVVARGRKIADSLLGSRQAFITADLVHQAGYSGGKAAGVALLRSPNGIAKLRNKKIKQQVREEFANRS